VQDPNFSDKTREKIFFYFTKRVQFWILILHSHTDFKFRSSIVSKEIFFIKKFICKRIMWTTIKKEKIAFPCLISQKHRVKVQDRDWWRNSEDLTAITWSDFYDYLSHVSAGVTTVKTIELRCKIFNSSCHRCEKVN